MRRKQLAGLGTAVAVLALAPTASAAANGRVLYGTAMGAIYAADGSGATFVHGGRYPSVSPDGKKVAFVDQSAVDGAAPAIWTANVDGSGAVEAARLPASAAAPLAWAPDGTRVAVVTGDAVAGWRLLVVKTDGSAPIVGADGVSVSPPSWAPDGISIAYTTANAADIGIARADGSGSTLPIRDATRDEAPAWSPDGSRIAFFREAASGFVLYAMHPDGSGLQQLGAALAPDPSQGPLDPPVWSPDGSRLAFGGSVVAGWARYSYYYYKRDVYTVNVDGTGERRLTDSGSLYAGETPFWSPDGRRLAFLSGRSGGWQLYDMNPDGSCETQVTTSPDSVATASWQPLAIGEPSPELGCAAIGVSGTIGADRTRPYLDDERVYVFSGTVANNGNRDSGAISFRIAADDARFDFASSPGGSCSAAGTVGADCELAPLARGATTTFEVRFRIDGTGWKSVSGTATAAGGPPDGDFSDNVAKPSRYFPFCEIATSKGATIRGTRGDDLICGTVGRDKIFAGDGEDHVNGGLSHDTLYGQGYRDWLSGGGGVDYVYGGWGDDRIHGDEGGDVLYGGAGSDRIHGDLGFDFIDGGSGPDYVYAGYGNDVIAARDGSRDHIYCGDGVDTVNADLSDAVTDCEHVVRRRR
jgi:Tol biopolymer transport system component